MTSESITFLSACLWGAALGVVYDLFRISRIAIKTCNVIIFIEDIIFFVIVTLSSFIFIVMKNDGVLRGFLIVGELLGALVYFSTISIIIMNAARVIIKVIKAFLKFMYKLLIRPFVKLFQWIYRKTKPVVHNMFTKMKPKKKQDNTEEIENNA
jgi:spore cortex biosynthesis protein YabQ